MQTREIVVLTTGKMLLQKLALFEWHEDVRMHEQIARGQALYTSPDEKCATRHGLQGLASLQKKGI